MTKEEYEKQQSVIRRVFDPDTGRHRYILARYRGDRFSSAIVIVASFHSCVWWL